MQVLAGAFQCELKRMVWIGNSAVSLKKLCFQPKVTLKKAAFCLMLLKALIQMLITGLKMH